jgi:GDP-D-mannose dehydratase
MIKLVTTCITHTDVIAWTNEYTTFVCETELACVDGVWYIVSQKRRGAFEFATSSQGSHRPTVCVGSFEQAEISTDKTHEYGWRLGQQRVVVHELVHFDGTEHEPIDHTVSRDKIRAFSTRLC